MGIASLTTSRPFASNLAEIEAKKHCTCGDGEAHAHCLGEDCDARIPEGESFLCPVCEDLSSRRAYCRRCQAMFYKPPQGTAMCPWHQQGICTEGCWQASILDGMKRAGFPPALLTRTLDNFLAYTPSLKKKVEEIRRYVEGDVSTGSFLTGAIGNGKTHMGAGVAHSLFGRGICGHYVGVLEFMMKCHETFSGDGSVFGLVNDLLSGRFLLLDDLGSEKQSEYSRQQVLYLVDLAIKREVALVVTSNLSLEALNKSEPRLASRLAEACRIFKFTEGDYRIHLAKARAKEAAE